MRSRRYYSHTRRAWTPRFWPTAIVTAAIVFGLAVVIPTTLGRLGMGLFVGGFLTMARWELWKWRHPRISDEEFKADYLAEMRKAAPWN